MTKKHQSDEQLPARSPIPTCLVSNGEFFPPRPSERQKQLAALIAEMSDVRARKLGLSRRAFLKTSAGMATALVAANLVNGCRAESDGGFMVPMAATYDQDCAREVFRAEYFILDVQTHHVDLESPTFQDPFWRDAYSCLRVGPESCTDEGLALIGQLNFIKEVFLDSETAVGVISGLPTISLASQAISPTRMADSRDLVNELGCSERMLSQGVVTPVLGPEAGTGTSIRDMEYQVRQLRASSIKCLGSTSSSRTSGVSPMPRTSMRSWAPRLPWR